MPRLRRSLAPLIVVAVALIASFAIAPVWGEGKSKGEIAIGKARVNGKALYLKAWKAGAKKCVVCHQRGPNKLTGRRIKAYPKYDKVMGKVVTVQQKINQMITSKSGGKELPLGSDQLNALEAYLSTLK